MSYIAPPYDASQSSYRTHPPVGSAVVGRHRNKPAQVASARLDVQASQSAATSTSTARHCFVASQASGVVKSLFAGLVHFNVSNSNTSGFLATALADGEHVPCSKTDPTCGLVGSKLKTTDWQASTVLPPAVT